MRRGDGDQADDQKRSGLQHMLAKGNLHDVKDFDKK